VRTPQASPSRLDTPSPFGHLGARARLFGATVLVLLVAACGGRDPAEVAPPDDDDDDPDPTAIAIPPRGTDATFDVATWNVEWFGDPGNGPTDELGQLQRVRDVLNGAQIDLWALQEIVGDAEFNDLVAAAPGFSGLIADDPSVEGGPNWYRDFGDNEQKPALVYRSSAVTVRSARIVLTDEDFAFAGRPPFEARITVSIGGATVDAVVLILHAKAATDADSYERRRTASVALQTYLDATWPTTPVWVLGDFNDDVDTSIRQGEPSPYQNFVDAADWSFTTAALSMQGATSTVGFSDMIDHHLTSDEASAGYVAGSAEVFRVDQWISGFGDSTSDHYPVIARYTLGGG
jgi:endonuclease/exonuclease/phosphatase family metal-dependent hydrolase